MTSTYVLTGAILTFIFTVSFLIVLVMYREIKKGNLIVLKLMCFCSFLSLSDATMKLMMYVMGELL